MKYNRHKLGKKSGFGGYTLVVCKAMTTPNFKQTNEITNHFDRVRNRI
jgi:hypothetical protein